MNRDDVQRMMPIPAQIKKKPPGFSAAAFQTLSITFFVGVML